jgi:hypothetical protein
MTGTGHTLRPLGARVTQIDEFNSLYTDMTKGKISGAKQ